MLTEKWGTNSGSVRLPGIKYWHGFRIVAHTVCPLYGVRSKENRYFVELSFRENVSSC